jgi:hypothetical protein
VNIQACLPNAQIIAILRHPADRAYAAYLHLVRDGRERLPFTDALAAEPERIAAGWEQLWHYRAMGGYARQLQRFCERFPRENLHIVLHDDLRTDAHAVVSGLYEFLGVDANFRPQIAARTNPGGIPRFPRLYRLLASPRRFRTTARKLVPAVARNRFSRRLRRWPVARPPLDAALRASLTEAFRDDILQLQDLLGRDLGHWLS